MGSVFIPCLLRCLILHQMKTLASNHMVGRGGGVDGTGQVSGYNPEFVTSKTLLSMFY